MRAGQRLGYTIAAVAVIALTMAGCAGSGSGNPRFGGSDDEDFMFDSPEPVPVEEGPPSSNELDQYREAPARWTCSYDPTYNRDWHDDVLCVNGSNVDRPYLLPNDDFVTSDEIAQAAQEYEDQLNATH